MLEPVCKLYRHLEYLGSGLNTVRLDKIALAMPMTWAQRRWLQTSRRAVDWHPGGQLPVMTSIGRVAPLDHSRRSFADGARGAQPGAGLKQLGEPTHP